MKSLGRWIRNNSRREKNARPPIVPSLEGLPVIGNTHQFVQNASRTFEQAVNRHGDIVSLRILGLGELVLVTSPDCIQQVLQDDREQYSSGQPRTADLLREVIGNGLVLNDGEQWQRQRQLIQPAFFRDRIAAYGPLMTEHAERIAKEWETGTTYDLEEEMRQLTLRIIVEAMFGTDLTYDADELRTAINHLEAPSRPRNQPIAYTVPTWVPLPMWRRFHESIDYFETIIEELIQRRQKRDITNRTDLLSILLMSREQSPDRMSDDQLRDEMMTFLFAGHETTALALTYTWYLLANHPEITARLHEELSSVLGGTTPTMADLPDLVVTERIIKESLRLYPPAPLIVRTPRTSVTLDQYRISADATVGLPQWVIHRDDRFYDEPETFRPTRWTDEFETTLPDYAYFPFGGGPRRCVGKQFAMVELQLLVATLALRYDFECHVDESLEVTPAVTLLPTERIDLEIQPLPDRLKND